MMSYALRMALSIKDPNKLQARKDAAAQLLGNDHTIYKCFEAVANNEQMTYYFTSDMSKECRAYYLEALDKYAIRKNKQEGTYFEIIDRTYIRYSPNTVLVDDIMVGGYSGDFIESTKCGSAINNLLAEYEDYIDSDAFNDELLDLFSDYVSGWNRFTLQEVIELGYGKADFEDPENFNEMPLKF